MVSRHQVKGILTICGGVLIHLSLGTLYTFGNINPYLTSYLRFRASKQSLDYTDTMWIFALELMGQGLTMSLGGTLEKKLRSRCTCLIGGLTMSFGVFMTHFAVQKSFVAVIFTYGLLLGIGIGIAYAVPMACAMKWFPTHKGLINGIIVSGFGAGAFVFDQVQTAYINPDNLKANLTIGPNDEKYFNQPKLLDRVPDVFIWLGLVYSIMQLIGSLLLLQPSNQAEGEVSSKDPLLEGVTDSDEERDDCRTSNTFKTDDKEPRSVIHTRAFWMLWFMFLVNSQAVIFISTLYKSYGETFISDDHFLALVGSFAAVFNGVGRILWGYLADRFTFRRTMKIQCFCMAFLFMTFVLTEKAGRWMYFIWVCLMFGTFSGNFSLFPTATAKSFGQKYFTINYGMVFTSQIISGAIGTLLAQNLSHYLGWFGIFCLVAGFAFVGLLLACSYNVKKPNGEDV